MSQLYSRVYGVNQKNNDGQNRQVFIRRYCKAGQFLILVMEPDNIYDPNAIGLWIQKRSFLMVKKYYQIGYINADLSEELSDHIRSGGEVTAKIKEVTGGTRKKPTRGINILITKE